MKKLLIMCGSGIATSTLATGKIKEWLKENNLENDVSITQSKVTHEVNHVKDYDAVVSTTVVPDNIKNDVISGLPLLTGVGVDEVFDQLAEKLN